MAKSYTIDLKKVKPLALEKYLDRVRNRVYRVGVELEGGWENIPTGCELIRDGSVNPGRIGPRAMPLHIGELVSVPMEPVRVAPWMKKTYPDTVNDTCGLHVHMSFKDARHYQQLMVPEYTTTMLHYLAEWGRKVSIPAGHPFWERVVGKNRFCLPLFFPDSQAQKTSKSYNHDGEGNRYSAINYCWGLHETVECRTLPMLERPELGIEAVHEVLNITNSFLAAAAEKEKHYRALVTADGDTGSREVRRVVV